MMCNLINSCHYIFANDVVKDMENFEIEEGVPTRVHEKRNCRQYVGCGIVAFMLLLGGIGIAIWSHTKVDIYEPIRFMNTNQSMQEVTETDPLLEELKKEKLPDLYPWFANEGITVSILWKLSEEELKSIGLNFGQRRTYKLAITRRGNL